MDFIKKKRRYIKKVTVPKKIIFNNRTYTFVKQVNNRICLYEEDKFKWKECFLITELIWIPEGGRII